MIGFRAQKNTSIMDSGPRSPTDPNDPKSELTVHIVQALDNGFGSATLEVGPECVNTTESEIGEG